MTQPTWTLYHCKSCGIPLGLLAQVKARVMLLYGGDFRGSLREPCPMCGERVIFNASTKPLAQMRPDGRMRHRLRINVVLHTLDPLVVTETQRPLLETAVAELAERQGGGFFVGSKRGQCTWMMNG